MADKKPKEEKAKEKNLEWDEQKAKKPCKPNNEQMVVQTNPPIIALLKSMQETLKKQDDKMDGFSSRLDQMENDLSYEDHNYSDGFYDDFHYEEGESDDSSHSSASCLTVGLNEVTLSMSKRPAEEWSRFESPGSKEFQNSYLSACHFALVLQLDKEGKSTCPDQVFPFKDEWILWTLVSC